MTKLTSSEIARRRPNYTGHDRIDCLRGCGYYTAADLLTGIIDATWYFGQYGQPAEASRLDVIKVFGLELGDPDTAELAAEIRRYGARCAAMARD